MTSIYLKKTLKMLNFYGKCRLNSISSDLQFEPSQAQKEMDLTTIKAASPLSIRQRRSHPKHHAMHGGFSYLLTHVQGIRRSNTS
jgi:hypothetical protein